MISPDSRAGVFVRHVWGAFGNVDGRKLNRRTRICARMTKTYRRSSNATGFLAIRAPILETSAQLCGQSLRLIKKPPKDHRAMGIFALAGRSPVSTLYFLAIGTNRFSLLLP